MVLNNIQFKFSSNQHIWTGAVYLSSSERVVKVVGAQLTKRLGNHWYNCVRNYRAHYTVSQKPAGDNIHRIK